MSNFDEKAVDRIKKLGAKVERLRVKESRAWQSWTLTHPLGPPSLVRHLLQVRYRLSIMYEGWQQGMVDRITGYVTRLKCLCQSADIGLRCTTPRGLICGVSVKCISKAHEIPPGGICQFLTRRAKPIIDSSSFQELLTIPFDKFAITRLIADRELRHEYDFVGVTLRE